MRARPSAPHHSVHDGRRPAPQGFTISGIRNEGASVTAGSDAYEELTRTLYWRLAAAQGIGTVRLERDIRVPGKATRHQIDVLWEFIDPATGDEQVVVFECRHYKSPINQGRLLEFKAVLEDCAAYEGSDGIADPHGVMVTLTGYQIGAKRVADTYGIEIVELRSPLAKDLVGRVNEIKVAMTLRTPVLDNFAVEPVDLKELDGASQVAGVNWDFEIEDADGTRRPLLHVLCAGELNSQDQPPREVHRVVRRFDTPVRLFLAGTFLGTVAAVGADVGETQVLSEFSVGGREYLSYVILNALSGERVWFAEDGRIWSTDAP